MLGQPHAVVRLRERRAVGVHLRGVDDEYYRRPESCSYSPRGLRLRTQMHSVAVTWFQALDLNALPVVGCGPVIEDCRWSLRRVAQINFDGVALCSAYPSAVG